MTPSCTGISHDLTALVEDGLGALAIYLGEPEPGADQRLQKRSAQAKRSLRAWARRA